MPRSPSSSSCARLDVTLFLRAAVSLWAAIFLCTTATPLRAQNEPTPQATQDLEATDDAEDAVGVPPSGSASLVLDGRSAGQIPFLVRGDGPRFALAPLAQLLGIELRVGPLGDMHTLIYDDKEIRLGPDHISYVVASDGDEQIQHLRWPPVKGIHGLMVPQDALDVAFGDELGVEIAWDFSRLELRVDRRVLREIAASIDLIHQYRVSTLEIALATKPRYRFARVDGAVEVRFVGDSIVLDEPFSRPADPLVRNVVVEPTKVRVELVEGAAAAEPRLVPDLGVFRLVVDVYRQRAAQTTDSRETPRLPDLGGIRTIVLDPGHGGEETGAIGRGGTVESELTLRVARLLRNRLEQRLPVRVLLTRDSDVDIPHDTRVALANQNKADLFVSLHFNSYRGSQARGAETFFLSREASDRVAEEVLAAEHSSMTEVERAEMADLELILWDLTQSYHLGESQRFANLVQEELNQALGLRDRGVRQAPFRVLMGATMPAVLVELGFLSNPAEEEKLQNPTYLGELVEALVRAISRFKTQMDARSGPAAGDSSPGSAPDSVPGPEDGP